MAQTGATKTRRAWGRGRTKAAAAAVLVLALVAGGWYALASTLSLGAATARAELEERIAALTGQPVIIDGRSEFALLPRPRLQLFDVRIGGVEPGQAVSIDELRAEFDLFDAVFGRVDIAALVLVRPELAYVEASPRRAGPDMGDAPPAGGLEGPDAGQAERELALRYGRGLLERFEGVRRVELRDGAMRGRDGSLAVASVNLQLDWPSRSDEARLGGTFVWNGQTATVDMRLLDPVRFVGGEATTLRLALASPSLDARFEGEAAGGEAVAFDGTLRMSTPSLSRAIRWIDGSQRSVPDIGAVSIETRIRHEAGARTAMDPVSVGIGEETGHGVLEAVFTNGSRPTFSGTLAFSTLDLDRFTHGIAPMPRHALDFQRPMAVSFIDGFDLDLRVSAANAGLGDTPVRQFAASLLFSGGAATLDIGDAELLDGSAQGRLVIDLSGPRPVARGRLDLVDVDAAGLATLTGIRSVGLTGRANLAAEFEAPATNWADILRSNVSSARLTLAGGTVSGIAQDLFDTPGEKQLHIGSDGGAIPFSRLEARFGTRGPFAALDQLSLQNAAGKLEAGGFLSLLDDRLFVEGAFTPAEGAVTGNPLFTTSQLVPFKMQGEWPEPTLMVGEGLDIDPI